jgi:hypothetical protein
MTTNKYDDYMTPKYAWSNIKDYIPKDKIIWEAFYGNGKSGEYLQELGFQVIHDKDNFFENDKGDIIISNPPFSMSKKVIERLKLLDKPFIIILPVSKITTGYFQNSFKHNNEFQIMIPPKRIHFEKLVNGVVPLNWKNQCNFDCFYYCYKINLKNDITWLN